MTTASKIHVQAPGKPKGTTVCGRKAPAERIVKDPADATCDVCIVTEVRQAVPAKARGGPNMIDRLVTAASSSTGPRTKGGDPARTAAYEALAARHMDEFLELYREALEADRR